MPFLYFPDNLDWSHNTFRAITQIACDGGDFGEIYRALNNIRVGNREDWYRGWRRSAEYVENLAKDAVAKGHLVTAWKSFFRAFSYYRQAQYILPPSDERKVSTYVKAVECFREGGKYHHPPIEPVEIPYGGTTLNGYMIHRIKDHKDKGPGVVWFGGADSPAEELYFQGASEAIQRGLTCLVVNGPGQGLTLYVKKIYSRHDYEKPYTSAIDFFTKRPEIDPKRIAIMGNSLGGYYVVRAAAFEERVRAAVAYGAVYDVNEDVFDFFPAIRPTLQWLVGARDEAEARAKFEQFTLRNVANRVTCPLLIVHGEEDYIAKADAAYKTRDGVRGPVELKMWKGSHSVREYHKEVLSYMFDWLSDRLKAP